MAIEIERKFLVNEAIWNKIPKTTGRFFRQGYILTDPAKTIRIRLTDKEGYITIKGLSVGASRPEFEFAIPAKDAEALLDQFCATDISKIRYEIFFKGKL